MAEKKLPSISSFEWASVGQYITYISGVAELKDVSSYNVWSFPLAKYGPEKLEARKNKVLAVIKQNQAKLERFVALHRDEIKDNELAVLRAIYYQNRDNIHTVMGHIESVKSYARVFKAENESVGEGGQDELPF